MIKRKGLVIPKQQILGVGRYHGTIIREGRVIDDWVDENLVVNSGLNDLLNCYFYGGTQTTTWFMGIFQGNYTPIATETASTVVASAQECPSYTSNNGNVRPNWTPAAPAAQAITNSANRATYTFNASVTVYGAFLISNNAINSGSGVLFSIAQFGSSKSVVNLDQLLLTYTFNASSVS